MPAAGHRGFSLAISLDGGRRDSAQRGSALPLLPSPVAATLRTQGCLLTCLLTNTECGVSGWQVPKTPLPPFIVRQLLPGQRLGASGAPPDNLPISPEWEADAQRTHLRSGMCRGLLSSSPAG